MHLSILQKYVFTSIGYSIIAVKQESLCKDSHMISVSDHISDAAIEKTYVYLKTLHPGYFGNADRIKIEYRQNNCNKYAVGCKSCNY